MNIKAITLWQPWASLIALGVKTIETRGWKAPDSLIGQRIAIHAAKRPADFATMKTVVGDNLAAWNAWHAAGYISGDGATDHIPYGAVVCTAILADCAPMVANDDRDDRPIIVVDNVSLTLWARNRPGWPYERGDNLDSQRPYGYFAPGRFAWLLSFVEQLDEPAQATGRQGIWEWTP